MEEPPWVNKEYDSIICACLCSVVMVVGAGRGPLVDVALCAAKTSERMVKVYAVEKNPGAVITYVCELWQVVLWGVGVGGL